MKYSKIILRQYWSTQFGEHSIDKSFTKETFLKKFGKDKFKEVQKYSCGVFVGKHNEWTMIYKEGNI